MKLVDVVIARLRHGKHVSAATDTDVFSIRTLLGNGSVHIFPQQRINTVIEELLEAVFSVWSTSRLHNKD
jgi:hypothetical protein